MYCGKCKIDFDPNKNAWWNEDGISGSVKLTKCPQCNKIKILKYVPDSFCRDYILKDIYKQEQMEFREKEKLEWQRLKREQN